jgi:hypothetical protein
MARLSPNSLLKWPRHRQLNSTAGEPMLLEGSTDERRLAATESPTRLIRKATSARRKKEASARKHIATSA